MTRVLKVLAAVAALLVLLVAGVAAALQHWLRTDDFRLRVERQATQALGVPVAVGRLDVAFWPLPAVTAGEVRVQAKPALVLGHVEARPVWSGLAAGRLAIATLVVRDAVLPQAAIEAIAAGLRRRDAGSGPGPAPSGTGGALELLPRRAVLDRVTGIDGKGQRLTVDARLDLGADGLPEKIALEVREGRLAGAKAQVRRASDHWPVQVEIGGGRITGRLALQPGKGGVQQLQGQLATENVEVSALTAPSRMLTGRLQAQTTLRAQFRELGQLVDALQTETRFTVKDAVVQGLDLAKAVQTVGLSRGGLTRLDALAGQVRTQGRAVHFTQLVATSGVLAAKGNVSVAPDRRLSGRITVDLRTVRGLVGVPLVVGGTVDDPGVTLTRSALLGAAVGTLVAPGVGTGAGASTGDKLGNKLRGLFGR